MAFNVEILRINDETGDMLVEFEDTSSNTVVRMGITLTQEYATEAELLDAIARFWPYEEFTQRGKAPADRHVRAKSALKVKKNITGRVQNP